MGRHRHHRQRGASGVRRQPLRTRRRHRPPHRLVFPLLKPFAFTPEQGAQTQVYVASAPELAGITGGYWVKSAPATPSRPRRTTPPRPGCGRSANSWSADRYPSDLAGLRLVEGGLILLSLSRVCASREVACLKPSAGTRQIGLDRARRRSTNAVGSVVDSAAASCCAPAKTSEVDWKLPRTLLWILAPLLDDGAPALLIDLIAVFVAATS